tara:strand:- start:4639 stop:5616 length:978 start_codon:yes stop_codon:yes gene_type:complete
MTDGSPTAIRDLHKYYGKVHALRGATMEIPPGTVGLLGPNGAGKTTLLKLLLGLLIPTTGDATIVGCDPRIKKDRLKIRQRVGYMPESDCLLPGMTGIEVVSLLGRLTCMDKEDAMTRAHESLDYVGLDEERYRPLVGYSTGMKQRLKLATALVHDPKVLLLDEPTNGLDPNGRKDMLELISDLGRKQGKNVLLCSHLLPDVEKTCDHVVVINQGLVVEQGSMNDLTRADEVRVRLTVEGESSAFLQLAESKGMVGRILADGRVELDLAEPEVDPIFIFAADAGFTITQVRPVKSTLEEVFMRAVDKGSSYGQFAEAGSQVEVSA